MRSIKVIAVYIFNKLQAAGLFLALEEALRIKFCSFKFHGAFACI